MGRRKEQSEETERKSFVVERMRRSGIGDNGQFGFCSSRENLTERERVRKKLVKEKWVQYLAAILFLAALGFLGVKAGRECWNWVLRKQAEEAVVEVQPDLPTVEVIDEASGKVARYDENEKKMVGGVSLRVMEYVSGLEKEFSTLGYKIARARVPAGKMREVDIEIEEVSGYLKTSLDRNPAVTAEDGDRMIRYLQSQEIAEFEYIDIRISRKGYWK